MSASAIVIHAKRWFEKTNGNTYHNVTITQENKLLANSGMCYGYDEQCIQTAHEMLVKLGITKLEYGDFRRLLNKETEFIAFIQDVNTKKEMLQ